MKPGMIIENDPRGVIIDKPVEGNSYKVGALPIGTKICFVEKIPGQGAQLAMSSGRYGIITGRIDRKYHYNPRTARQIEHNEGRKARALVVVSFPYASMDGFRLKTPHGKFCRAKNFTRVN